MERRMTKMPRIPRMPRKLSLRKNTKSIITTRVITNSLNKTKVTFS